MKDNLGVWFDFTSMDRVSGWYRRKIQSYILIIAVFISFGLGVDTLALVKFLRADSALRESLVAVAKDEVEKPSAPTASDSAAPHSGRADRARLRISRRPRRISRRSRRSFPISISRATRRTTSRIG